MDKCNTFNYGEISSFSNNPYLCRNVKERKRNFGVKSLIISFHFRRENFPDIYTMNFHDVLGQSRFFFISILDREEYKMGLLECWLCFKYLDWMLVLVEQQEQ